MLSQSQRLLLGALLFPSLIGGCNATVALPRDVPLSHISADAMIGANNEQTCLLQSDGKPLCWRLGSRFGKNSPTSTWPAKPVPGIEGAVVLAVGGRVGCVIRRDDSISCWETNMGGDKIRDVRTIERPETLGKPAALGVYGVVNGAYACVIDTQGAVGCFKFDLDSPPANPPKDVRLASMSGNERHACGVTREKRVVCWGSNSLGQLGRGAATDGPVPGIDDAIEVAAGRGHTCVRRSSGKVSCWGDNEYGQLGDGRAGGSRAQPGDVMGIDDAMALAAGSYHTCAVRRSGQLACWGGNPGGGLADGTTRDHATPVLAPNVSDAIRVTAAFYQTCVLRRAGKVTCWGLSDVQGVTIDLSTGEVTEQKL